jgi:hypothetical protein
MVESIPNPIHVFDQRGGHGKLFCAFSCPVNCVVGGFEEVRIQMLKLGRSHSSGGKA